MARKAKELSALEVGRLTVPGLRLCSEPQPNQPTGERTVKAVPILEPRYSKAAFALGIQPVDLYSLPANSLLGLLLRCCNRCEDPLDAIFSTLQQNNHPKRPHLAM